MPNTRHVTSLAMPSAIRWRTKFWLQFPPPKSCGRPGQLSPRVNIMHYVTSPHSAKPRRWPPDTCGMAFEKLILLTRRYPLPIFLFRISIASGRNLVGTWLQILQKEMTFPIRDSWNRGEGIGSCENDGHASSDSAFLTRRGHSHHPDLGSGYRLSGPSPPNATFNATPCRLLLFFAHRHLRQK